MSGYRGALDGGPLSSPWPEAAQGRRPRPTIGGSVTGLGVAVGLIVIGMAAYQLLGTGIGTSHAQAKLRSTPIVAHAPLGAPVARLRIPRIGLDVMVVEGVGLPQLARGPGRYPASAPIGSTGVTAIAGHSSGWGAPFMRFGRLREGDVVFLEARGHRYAYRITHRGVVHPRDVWVLNGDPWSRAPSKLVLTTCWPVFTSRDRLILWGDLESVA
ncbi:MAG: sortase [Actinomycetota bacterium]